MYAIIFSFFLFLTIYAFYKKNEHLIFALSMQGIILDILSIQYHANISILKFIGIIYFFKLLTQISRYSFSDLQKIIKIMLGILIFFIISFFYFTVISPWTSEFSELTYQKNFIKGLKQIFTFMSELGVIYFFGNYFSKNQFNHLKTYFSIILVFVIAIFIEKFFRIDLYHFFTNGPEMLIAGRTRGFTFEPRAASYYSAILLLCLIPAPIKNKYKLIIFPILLTTFIFSKSMTGMMIIVIGIIILITSAFLRNMYFKKEIIIGIVSVVVSIPILHEFGYIDSFKQRLQKRSYVFAGKTIADKLEYADSAAIRFLLQNKTFLFLGVGTGQIAVASTSSLTDDQLYHWKDGLTYLPFMGIVLILSNGGIVLLSTYIYLIFFGLKQILYLNRSKASIDALLSYTLIFIITYFFQVRYFHLIGFGLLLYAEISNKDKKEYKTYIDT